MSKITKMMLLANQNKTHNRDYDHDTGRYGYDRQEGYRSNNDAYSGYPMRDSMITTQRQHPMRDFDRYDNHANHAPREYQRQMQHRERYDDWDDPDYERESRARRMKRRARQDDWDEDDDSDYERDPKSRKKKRRGESDDWEEDYPEHVSETKAREWVVKMRNTDGSQGTHFAPDTAEQLRVSHCPDCDRWDFFAAVNMMYSDYSAVLKKFGMDKPEVYACLSKAFLCDEDAKPGKLARYMKCISK